jgi:hypothetical protein
MLQLLQASPPQLLHLLQAHARGVLLLLLLPGCCLLAGMRGCEWTAGPAALLLPAACLQTQGPQLLLLHPPQHCQNLCWVWS